MRIELSEAVRLLKAGLVVAIPTETVYGLAASLQSPQAIDQIYRLKNRPDDNPLIVHIASYDQMRSIVKSFPLDFERLVHAFWPGPLTLILPVRDGVIPARVTAGQQTVGIRMPAHDTALEVIRQVGPLVAPSANLSGKPSGTCLEHIEDDFGIQFPVLDGGPCEEGMESTILYPAITGWKIVRHGAISAEQIETVLGYSVLPSAEEVANWKNLQAPICPGQRYRHYAPRANLVLGYESYRGAPSVVLGFLGRSYPHAKKVIILGDLEYPESISSGLYDQLRLLDHLGIDSAWVDCQFTSEGILRTVLERLQRASS